MRSAAASAAQRFASAWRGCFRLNRARAVKILLTGTSLLPAYGGPAYSVSRLATALAELEMEVGIWAPDQSASATPLLAAKSKVVRLTGSANEAIRRFGVPDVMHDNGIWLPHHHQLARLARKRGIPRVVSTRGTLERWAMNHKRWKKTIAWWVYQRRDLREAFMHHATAQTEAETIKTYGFGVPVCVIPNGVDMAQPAAASARENRTRKIALFLGRIYPVKGLPNLIEAWARVRPPHWVLRIVGPDEAGHQKRIQEAVAAAGLEDAVEFVGAVYGRAKTFEFNNADMFVLPTHSENFGMAIAEALAHGLPVLTTTAAPWPLLQEYGCGWWVAPTPDGLEFALRDATSRDRAALASMGEKGRAFIALELSWDRIAEKFLGAYDQCASRAQSTANAAAVQ
jgi:glycosyltransferase involved in cell wall biosynthesis